jgi:hypothetical protein
VITDVGFSMVLACNHTGAACGHIEFDFNPKTDEISEVKINGEVLDPQEPLIKMVRKLYPAHVMYKQACLALDQANGVA